MGVAISLHSLTMSHPCHKLFQFTVSSQLVTPDQAATISLSWQTSLQQTSRLSGRRRLWDFTGVHWGCPDVDVEGLVSFDPNTRPRIDHSHVDGTAWLC